MGRSHSNMHLSSIILMDNFNKSNYKTSCVAYEKEPTAQIAHLVFADTLANAEKTKRAIFCQHLNRTKVLTLIL
jgi:uncharacterized protein (DUF924 family)